MNICRICDHGIQNETYSVREMHFGTKEVFEYFLCSRCGCLQIADPPKELSKYYSDTYYSFLSDPDKQDHDLSVLRRIKERAAMERNRYELFRKPGWGMVLEMIKPKPLSLFELLHHCQVSLHSSILDVGCGTGIFLHELTQMGMKNLLGVDPYISRDVTYANGLKIIRTDLTGLNGKWKNGFDVIMFNHSFEHLPDPYEVLLTTGDLLKPDGILMIRIPTVSSYVWQQYKTDWVQIDAPRHFYIHSVESIKILAKKARFEIFKIVDDSTSFQFWGSEQYRQDIPLSSERSYSKNPRASIFSTADMARYENITKTLNQNRQGDQAAFYLRKI